MSTASALTVTLPPDLQNLIRSKISKGLYQSAEEVVRAALRLLAEQEQRAVPAKDSGSLRARIDAAYADGPDEDEQELQKRMTALRSRQTEVW